MSQRFFTSAMAMVMLAAVATPVFSQSQGAGAKLAKETVQLLATQEMMLVTAVRQKNSRGGAEDFKRFIMQPLESMSDRWRALPPEERLNRIHCITALQEFENHASDSFKAALMTVAALVLAPESQARSRSSGSSRPSVSRSGRSSGGGSVGCGSRGGAGYRKANGKCAGRNE